MAKKSEANAFVGIAGTISGTLVAMVFLFVMFAREFSWVLIPIAGCMALLGIVLGAFAAKKK
jgi:hypothetical protein